MPSPESQQSAGTQDLFQGQNIHPKFVNLLDLLARVRELPQTLTETAREELLAYAMKNLPPIWMIWSMLVLMYFRDRIKWVRSHRPLLERVITRVRDGSPDVPVFGGEGNFPDMPDWEYYVTPNSTHMNNLVTGEYIVAEPCRSDDAPSFHDVVETLGLGCSANPLPVYDRARQLFPSVAGIYVALALLETRYGVLVRDESGEVRLHPTLVECQNECSELFDQLRFFPETWPQIAAALGDCLYWEERTQSPRVKRWTEDCRTEWRGILCAEAAQGLTPNLVHALADAGALDPHLDDALSNPATAEAAVDYVFDDPKWVPNVWDVFQHPECCGQNCARYLVRHGHQVQEVLTKLAGQEYGYDDAVVFAVQYAPQWAPTLLRQGINSFHLHDRQTAATNLALFDCEYTREILGGVLRDSNDWEWTECARVALHDSADPTKRQLAVEWENEHRASRPDNECDEMWLEELKDTWTYVIDKVREQTPGC